MDRKIQAVAAELKKDIAAKYELLDFKVFGKDGLDDLFSKTPLYRQVVEEGIAI